MTIRASLLAGTVLAASLSWAAPTAAAGIAENPILYFVIPDRFENGDPSNDRSYGRQPDGDKEIGTFHGGDLKGLTARLKQGWFKELGVNAIWITAPFEQMRGWVVGGEKSFKHYGYHGYYALDYTLIDKNMGSDDDLRELVETAHGQGIRILLDVVMNHPGYADLWTLNEFGVKVLWPGWEAATLQDYHTWINYNDFAFRDWWGGTWVRAGLPGYPDAGRDDLTSQLAFLPDFRTESPQAVGLPPFLKRKPDTKAREIPGATVRDYLVTWLTDWVRRYGIDGFRADTVKHVEPESWLALKREATKALAEWKAANPTKKIDDAPFWMVGEVFGAGPERSPWHDAGFDSLINFDLQPSLEKIIQPGGSTIDWAALDRLYAAYAKDFSATRRHDTLSYLSSHDTKLFPRDRLMAAATAMMLLPGGVQIFYGDETGRRPGPMPDGDPQQATRSPMNWRDMDRDLLAHWRKLGQFRARHPAIARGAHEAVPIAEGAYAFRRILPASPTTTSQAQPDAVMVVQGNLPQALAIPVSWSNGTKIRDAYSGQVASVSGGTVTFAEPAVNNLRLLEAAP